MSGRPVAAWTGDYPAGHLIAPHRHAQAQLVYAAAGVMTVTAAAGAWLVPPQCAVWVPAGVEHSLLAHGPMALRTLYFEPAAAPLPDRCAVIAVAPLLRELILAVTALPPAYDTGGADGRLLATLRDRLRLAPETPLFLPMPRDRRLAALCRALADAPGDGRPLAAWGRRVGASARTLARLFVAETGMTFGRWRRRARLQAAIRRLAAGEPVIAVALDLGYEGPSAFIAMFRRALGRTPGRYVAELAGRGPRPM